MYTLYSWRFIAAAFFVFCCFKLDAVTMLPQAEAIFNQIENRWFYSYNLKPRLFMAACLCYDGRPYNK